MKKKKLWVLGWLWPTIFLNVAFLMFFVLFFFLVLLKICFWQVEVFGISPYILEGGVEPYSMLDMGEKLHGGPIYQIWLDELTKVSTAEKQLKSSVGREAAIPDAAVPYMAYKTEPQEIRTFYDKVIKLYLSTSSKEELEFGLQAYLEDYLKSGKNHISGALEPDRNLLMPVSSHFLNPTELRNSSFLGQKEDRYLGKWTDLAAPDIDLSDFIRLKRLLEMRGLFLLDLDLKGMDFTKEERETFLKKELIRLALDKGFPDRIVWTKELVTEGTRFLYHWFRIYDYIWKSHNFPAMIFALRDGPIRWRGSGYYNRKEYWSSWRHFRSTDHPKVYLRYGLPRRTPTLFFDFYRWSWLNRELVHTSNYQEALRDFHNKLRYRILDYYLDRAERKYFYRKSRSIPDLYRYSQKQTFRKSRRLTWLRRNKRYLLGEYTTLLKLRPYLYMLERRPDARQIQDEDEKEEFQEELKPMVFGRRRKYRKKKFRVIDSRKVHYRLAYSKRAFPRFYVDDMKEFPKGLLLPNDHPLSKYMFIKLFFLHFHYNQRGERYEDFSFYEKWLFEHCTQFRTLGKVRYTPQFPLFWFRSSSVYGKLLYFKKDYLPYPYWILFKSQNKFVRSWYKDVSVPSKSLMRDSWLGVPLKRYSEYSNREFQLRSKKSPLKKNPYLLLPWLKEMELSRGFSQSNKRGVGLLKKLQHSWERNRMLSWRNSLEGLEKVFRASPFRKGYFQEQVFEEARSSRGWFTGFRIPPYRDLSFFWLCRYASMGFWLENHFGTYLLVLSSGFLYWVTKLGGFVVSNPYFWLGWIFVLLSSFFFILWLVRNKEFIREESYLWKKDSQKLEVSEDDFVFWFFKTNYRYDEAGLGWDSLGKSWKFSNFYLLDKFYYRFYGKSFFLFQNYYEEEKEEWYNRFLFVLIRFLFFLMCFNFLIGVCFGIAYFVYLLPLF